MNDGLSMANIPNDKLPLRSSESIYKPVEHRKHNKAAFKHYTLAPTKLFNGYPVT